MVPAVRMQGALTFFESLILLVVAAALAAALTGVLAPVIVQRASRRRLREQKRFEEDLQRETAFIAAQAAMLQDLASALRDFQAKGLAVSYAGAYTPSRLKEAWDAYERDSFGLLARISSLISISGTLFPASTVAHLREFYEAYLVQEFDPELSRMGRAENTSQREWQSWHDPHHCDAEAKTAVVLATVADEAGISYEARVIARAALLDEGSLLSNS
jgi:hypothetical protein